MNKETTDSVGEFFRQVRETKGLTLDEVASKTRIHPDFLKALEEGNFAKLPDQVFAKGFVRSYARSLGLDEEDAMRRFTDSAGAFYNKQGELERLRLKQAEDERRRKANRKVVMAAVGVALLGLILLLTREQSAVVTNHATVESEGAARTGPTPAARPSRPQAVREATTEGPAAGPSSVRPESGQAAGSEASVQPPTPEPPPAPAPAERTESAPLAAAPSEPLGGLPREAPSPRNPPLILDLEAQELSWVVVQVDNGSPTEALLRQGERVRWKASDRFVLTLGNAGGVRVELNGKPQGPFGPSGKVARDIVLKR
ncbi:MAG: helix-turn-helix domain-containing protein [Nitrospirae bacterium]|nr:helix-turn-helix domain-containing protein [Nitrospirota bacterium]